MTMGNVKQLRTKFFILLSRRGGKMKGPYYQTIFSLSSVFIQIDSRSISSTVVPPASVLATTARIPCTPNSTYSTTTVLMLRQRGKARAAGRPPVKCPCSRYFESWVHGVRTHKKKRHSDKYVKCTSTRRILRKRLYFLKKSKIKNLRTKSAMKTLEDVKNMPKKNRKESGKTTNFSTQPMFYVVHRDSCLLPTSGRVHTCIARYDRGAHSVR